MSIKVFENQQLFNNFVSKYGLNLFLGAGFSTYAYNFDDETLPLGNVICKRLIDNFGLNPDIYTSLGKVCQKIKRTQEDEFNIFLKEIYRVKSYDEVYSVLPQLPIKNIFTINIDDLIEKVYASPDSIKEIADSYITGNLQKENIVSLYKLHGSVTYPATDTMRFTIDELNNLFVTDNQLFQTVSYKMSCAPTIFWGTSLGDGNIIQLLNNSKFNAGHNIPNWIVLYPEDKNYGILCEEFHDMGFNIIAADTKDLLEYLSTQDFVQRYSDNKYILAKYRGMFPNNFICKELRKAAIARPVDDFFHGAEPQISDILSLNVVRTSYYPTLQNTILANKTTLITGIPGCGKSTLLLQLAFSDDIVGHKFWFNYMIASEAEKLCELVKGDTNVIIFLDNLYNNLEAYNILRKYNIKLVIAERAINYEYVKTSLNISTKNIFDISELNENDIQNICHSMSKPSKAAIEMLRSKSNVSLLELVFLAYHSKTAISRIEEYIDALQKINDDHLKIDILELYALVNYVSFCGVPTSMDMLIFYFNNNVSYQDIYYAIDKLNSIIIEDPSAYKYDSVQDYITMRSKLFAELSINKLPKAVIKKVLINFSKNVSSYAIMRYDIFKKKAYDADITVSAFTKDEGIAFYEYLTSFNNSPYIKHQYALFLQRKNDIDKAWQVVDQAYAACAGKIYTIANTHAMILFEKNINSSCDSSKENELKEILNRSFETLEYCVTKDLRVNYHVLVYSRNTLKYVDRFGIDDYAQTYITNALKRVTEILDSDEYIYRKLRDELSSQHKALLALYHHIPALV